MDALDALRTFNAVLAFIAACYLMIDLRTRFVHLSERRLYLTFALAGLLFTTSIANVEAIYQDAPLGYRTFLYTACALWTIIGLYLSRNDKT